MEGFVVLFINGGVIVEIVYLGGIILVMFIFMIVGFSDNNFNGFSVNIIIMLF